MKRVTTLLLLTAALTLAPTAAQADCSGCTEDNNLFVGITEQTPAIGVKGSLPVTGGDTDWTPVGIAGIITLGAGVGLVVLARRRQHQ